MSSAPSLEHDGRSECVLVVDDEPAVRQLIAGILAKAGHRVLTANSGQEAIRVLESEDVAPEIAPNRVGAANGFDVGAAFQPRQGLDVEPLILEIEVAGDPDPDVVADDAGATEIENGFPLGVE